MSDEGLSPNDRFTANLGRLTVSLPVWLWGAIGLLPLLAIAAALYIRTDSYKSSAIGHYFYRNEVKRNYEAGYWTDRKTGLDWTSVSSFKFIDLDAKPPQESDSTWDEAVNFCKNLTLKDMRWHLPDRRQMETIRNSEHVNYGHLHYMGENLWTSDVVGKDGEPGSGYALAFDLNGKTFFPMEQSRPLAAAVCYHKAAE